MASVDNGVFGRQLFAESRPETWENLALAAGFKPVEVARRCQVSLRTLQRHFQKNYGTTVSDWMRDYRLKEAYVRLQQGARVKEVAGDLGYKQLSHFSRDFKACYGLPPRSLSNPVLSGRFNGGGRTFAIQPGQIIEPGSH